MADISSRQLAIYRTPVMTGRLIRICTSWPAARNQVLRRASATLAQSAAVFHEDNTRKVDMGFPARVTRNDLQGGRTILTVARVVPTVHLGLVIMLRLDPEDRKNGEARPG